MHMSGSIRATIENAAICGSIPMATAGANGRRRPIRESRVVTHAGLPFVISDGHPIMALTEVWRRLETEGWFHDDPSRAAA